MAVVNNKPYIAFDGNVKRVVSRFFALNYDENSENLKFKLIHPFQLIPHTFVLILLLEKKLVRYLQFFSLLIILGRTMCCLL